jgi:hypothetical protein
MPWVETRAPAFGGVSQESALMKKLSINGGRVREM